MDEDFAGACLRLLAGHARCRGLRPSGLESGIIHGPCAFSSRVNRPLDLCLLGPSPGHSSRRASRSGFRPLAWALATRRRPSWPPPL